MLKRKRGRPRKVCADEDKTKRLQSDGSSTLRIIQYTPIDSRLTPGKPEQEELHNPTAASKLISPAPCDSTLTGIYKSNCSPDLASVCEAQSGTNCLNGERLDVHDIQQLLQCFSPKEKPIYIAACRPVSSLQSVIPEPATIRPSVLQVFVPVYDGEGEHVFLVIFHSKRRSISVVGTQDYPGLRALLQGPLQRLAQAYFPSQGHDMEWTAVLDDQAFRLPNIHDRIAYMILVTVMEWYDIRLPEPIRCVELWKRYFLTARTGKLQQPIQLDSYLEEDDGSSNSDCRIVSTFQNCEKGLNSIRESLSAAQRAKDAFQGATETCDALVAPHSESERSRKASWLMKVNTTALRLSEGSKLLISEEVQKELNWSREEQEACAQRAKSANFMKVALKQCERDLDNFKALEAKLVDRSDKLLPRLRKAQEDIRGCFVNKGLADAVQRSKSIRCDMA